MKPTVTKTTDSFFALLDKRQRDNLAKQAAERKDHEDKRLARIKPWWLEASQ